MFAFFKGMTGIRDIYDELSDDELDQYEIKMMDYFSSLSNESLVNIQAKELDEISHTFLYDEAKRRGLT
jgi:hypothetical protein